jgi:hypothetical protein
MLSRKNGNSKKSEAKTRIQKLVEDYLDLLELGKTEKS